MAVSQSLAYNGIKLSSNGCRLTLWAIRFTKEITMKRLLAIGLPVLLAMVFIAGCSTTEPVTSTGRDTLGLQVQGAINTFKTRRPSTVYYFNHAYAYAIFPNVGGGAVGIGGAGGRGEVFQQGKLIGYCKLVQGTIGAQLGGQTFAEVIFFHTAADLADFKTGQIAFDARATAVAAASGAGTAANYEHGTMVYVLPLGGLMAQASIGGQQFTFVPLGSHGTW
jgi:hypothetical protein